MLRSYEKTVVNYGDAGRGTPAYVIRCSKCEKVETIKAGKNSGSLNVSFVTKKFLQQGWVLGRTSKNDVCPACAHPSKKIACQSTETVMSNVTPITAKADAPPQMTKEDRRIIFAKIDENYIDETSGYSGGWSDEKIAKDLNVPRAWVAEIREHNFGPEVGESVAEDIEKLKTAIAKGNMSLQELDRKMEAARNEFMEAERRLEAAREICLSSVDKFKAERRAFEEAVREATARLDKITSKK